MSVKSATADSVVLTLAQHRFVPDKVGLTAGRSVELVVKNIDLMAEEFVCPSLKINKVLIPVSTVTLSIGPLNPGQHECVGNLHSMSARLVFTVSEPAPPLLLKEKKGKGQSVGFPYAR